MASRAFTTALRSVARASSRSLVRPMTMMTARLAVKPIVSLYIKREREKGMETNVY